MFEYLQSKMNTPSQVITPSTPSTPEKTKVHQEFHGTPRQLDFENITVDPIPGMLVQPFEQIEWVYPNDGESEFYSYEQMMNDYIPSDLEDESSSDEEEEYYMNEEDDFY